MPHMSKTLSTQRTMAPPLPPSTLHTPDVDGTANPTTLTQQDAAAEASNVALTAPNDNGAARALFYLASSAGHGDKGFSDEVEDAMMYLATRSPRTRRCYTVPCCTYDLLFRCVRSRLVCAITIHDCTAASLLRNGATFLILLTLLPRAPLSMPRVSSRPISRSSFPPAVSSRPIPHISSVVGQRVPRGLVNEGHISAHSRVIWSCVCSRSTSAVTTV